MKLVECPVSAEQAVKNIVDHPGHELQFARQSTGARIHVLRPWHNDGMTNDPDQLQTSGLWIMAASIFGWSLCGQRLNLNPDDSYRATVFRDEDLCTRCYRLLQKVGEEQTMRCFEHDRPEDI